MFEPEKRKFISVLQPEKLMVLLMSWRRNAIPIIYLLGLLFMFHIGYLMWFVMILFTLINKVTFVGKKKLEEKIRTILRFTTILNG